ncbi:hypothetical protein CC78DRAFT_355829 [Lojkania enalia]|uniref:Galactose oxidase/kelch, beta-propeller n=1 Tax=Lojkania enalia TaxID=147567 RepID=A0A9P4K3K0_9PLEO|nr:hypothetical protein CC78DRAFT_355829 [Didymosphaeria enalia]
MGPSVALSKVSMGLPALLHVLLIWSCLLHRFAAAQMPYNPSRILQNGTLLYIFRPSPSSSFQFELGSVNISSEMSAPEPPYITLYPALPFLESDSPRSFAPVLDHDGNITVYTGDCTTGASGSELWRFAPDPSEKSGNGSWQQANVSYDKNDQHAQAIGSNYLNGGVAFSSIVNGGSINTSAYFFGGMCPTEDSSSDWQSAANYSNFMVSWDPIQDGTKPIVYQLSESTSRGPPIAEAGFTFTGLQPSFSNRSDGTQTQQQNFVLVGGHTSAAFINMSQVALFALPQQSWTFVPVLQPNTHRTDLAIRTDIEDIEPRSGHTAVLTPDGQRIIVSGGWIGDIDTPAVPQLAVLNVGEGYGGQGSWEWTVPSTSGDGPSEGTGIYGHGAAMLPGGVMMITGGFSISASDMRSRRASQISNTQTFFFNVSSNNWISNYSPPPRYNLTPATKEESGPFSKTAQKAGLGVGLGLGMAAVLSLLAFYIWYTRRMKKQRNAREKQLHDLAMEAHRYNLVGLSSSIDGRGGQVDAVGYFEDRNTSSYFYPTAEHNSGQGWRRANAHDAERTGLLVEIPSPTRGLRRSLGGRQNHHLVRYEERRASHIHPIDEVEEEQEQENTTDQTLLAHDSEMAETPLNGRVSIFNNAPKLDPFTDSHFLSRPQRNGAIRSAPVSPAGDGGRGTSYDLDDWQLVSDLPQHPSPNSSGRVSPTKSDRTGSNLSERSNRSNLSSTSATGSMRRSISLRSSTILNNASHANPFKTPEASPTIASRNSGTGWQSPADPRTRSFTSIRSNGRPGTANADADSFMTARSSFMQLQAEGEALLGGNPERTRPNTSSTSNATISNTCQDMEPSTSRTGTTTVATSLIDGSTRSRERRKSWLGTVRRALSRSITTNERTRSLTTATPRPEASYKDDPLEVPTMLESKRRSFPASSPPRRAASDASFWQSKRGQRDWLDDELDADDPKARWRRKGGDDWGAPEDLEFAEKERRRQEWRERSTLVDLTQDEPTSRAPVILGDEASKYRPTTPAEDDEDWDVEAAVERRVVQVCFTVPKSRLRVVNADVDRASVVSLPRDDSPKSKVDKGDLSSPSRVRDLVGKFEERNSPRTPPRTSPRPSPSPSIRSVKLRGRGSEASL